MKRYDIATRVLVDFEPGIGAKPAFFICASGTRAKVDRIIKKDEARWGFRSFTRYFLEFGDALRSFIGTGRAINGFS